jgi:sarcosine oxidase subunit gamma
MHKLKPITPLGNDTAQVDRIGGLTITENPDRALASLSARLGREGETADKAQAMLGFALPGPGAWAASAGFMAWWMGPDSWMVDADHGSHELLASEIKATVGDAASVVEQTDGWCRFDVEGADCAAMFERLCNVDIRAMAAGAATRTSIEHLGCFLICLEAGAKFAVIGPRSSAGSLHHALVTAAKSAS